MRLWGRWFFVGMARFFIIFLLFGSLVAGEGLPVLKADHLRALSDARGISEFAQQTQPLRDRFCIEDTARALVAVLRMHELMPSDACRDLARLYMDAIADLHRAEKPFSFGYQGDSGPMQRRVEGDNFTRVLWGLGHAAAHGVDEAMRARAAGLFESALTGFDPAKRQPISQAYALQGLHEFLKARPDHAAARQALVAASESLLDRMPSDENAAWPWPSSVVTYDSARLPLALLLAYETTHDERFKRAGIRLLDFLSVVNFPGDGKMLHVIGNKGWYHQGQSPSEFDQQPIDASSLVEVCAAAWRATGEAKWKERCAVAFAWFTGHNARHTPLYDAASGGCHDALGQHGINANEGAESTLFFWIARCVRESCE